MWVKDKSHKLSGTCYDEFCLETSYSRFRPHSAAVTTGEGHPLPPTSPDPPDPPSPFPINHFPLLSPSPLKNLIQTASGKKSRSSPLQVKVGLSDDVTMAEPPTATNEISTSVSNSLKVDLLSTSTVTTVHSSVSTEQSPLATQLVTGKEPPSLETTTLPPAEPSPCFETILPNYIALPQKHSPLLINLPQNHTAHLLLVMLLK